MLHKLSSLGPPDVSQIFDATNIAAGLAGNLIASDVSGTSNILKVLESTGIGSSIGAPIGLLAGHLLGSRLAPDLGAGLGIAGTLAGAGIGGYMARRKLDEYDTAEERQRMGKSGSVRIDSFIEEFRNLCK